MRPLAVDAAAIFEAHQKTLNWQWVAGQEAGQRGPDPAVVRRAQSSADLVGYLNYLHPFRIQVLGTEEVRYLGDCKPGDATRRMARIVTLEPPLLIVCDGQAVPAGLDTVCTEAGLPLFRSPESASHVIDVLRSFLSRHFADQVSEHGVFMDILGVGVLITGASGLGKSELGLELVSRGHGLVADDVVDLFRVRQTIIEGRCPQLLQNLLEVRGIGLLDVRAIFGETAVRRRMRLHLIVHLTQLSEDQPVAERLPPRPGYRKILGVDIEQVSMQVAAGRNLSVLVEAAVRNYVLRLRGIDAYQEFVQRQRLAMQADTETADPPGPGGLRGEGDR